MKYYLCIKDFEGNYRTFSKGRVYAEEFMPTNFKRGEEDTYFRQLHGELMLKLKHGRDNPEDAGGSQDNVRLVDIKSVEMIYHSVVRVGYTGRNEWDFQAGRISPHDDMYVYKGKYYSDLEVLPIRMAAECSAPCELFDGERF